MSKRVGRIGGSTKQLVACFLAGLIWGAMAPFIWAKLLIITGTPLHRVPVSEDYLMIDAGIFVMAAVIYFTGQRNLAALFLGAAIGFFIGINLLWMLYYAATPR